MLQLHQQGGVGELQALGLGADHLPAQDDVAQELARHGAFRGRGVGQLFDFAQVVEDGPGQDQVPVQVGIDGQRRQGVAGHEPGVLQETAQVRVVIEAGRGADQELLLVAVQDLEDQTP